MVWTIKKPRASGLGLSCGAGDENRTRAELGNLKISTGIPAGQGAAAGRRNAERRFILDPSCPWLTRATGALVVRRASVTTAAPAALASPTPPAPTRSRFVFEEQAGIRLALGWARWVSGCARPRPRGRRGAGSALDRAGAGAAVVDDASVVAVDGEGDHGRPDRGSRFGGGRGGPLLVGSSAFVECELAGDGLVEALSCLVVFDLAAGDVTADGPGDFDLHHGVPVALRTGLYGEWFP